MAKRDKKLRDQMLRELEPELTLARDSYQCLTLTVLRHTAAGIVVDACRDLLPLRNLVIEQLTIHQYPQEAREPARPTLLQKLDNLRQLDQVFSDSFLFRLRLAFIRHDQRTRIEVGREKGKSYFSTQTNTHEEVLEELRRHAERLNELCGSMSAEPLSSYRSAVVGSIEFHAIALFPEQILVPGAYDEKDPWAELQLSIFRIVREHLSAAPESFLIELTSALASLHGGEVTTRLNPSPKAVRSSVRRSGLVGKEAARTTPRPHSPRER